MKCSRNSSPMALRISGKVTSPVPCSLSQKMILAVRIIYFASRARVRQMLSNASLAIGSVGKIKRTSHEGPKVLRTC